MTENKHTNITIWQSTVDMLRMAAAMSTITTGEKVSQVQFMDEAIREKIERDGLQMPAAK